ncbi:MAG: hypothetical protein Q9208_004090, partial [Pyrenodesmia sp. 3 TL-2023]
IVNMQRNVPLRSEWELEENYNFHDFHRPGCKEKETNGECGCEGQTRAQVTSERQLRKDLDRQRKKERSGQTAAPEEQKSSRTLPTKMEESGDEEFVMKMPVKSTSTKVTPAMSSLGFTPQACFRIADHEDTDRRHTYQGVTNQEVTDERYANKRLTEQVVLRSDGDCIPT